MLVWLVVLVAWTVIAAGGALLIGATAGAADSCERARRVPTYVPDDWSLTPSR